MAQELLASGLHRPTGMFSPATSLHNLGEKDVGAPGSVPVPSRHRASSTRPAGSSTPPINPTAPELQERPRSWPNKSRGGGVESSGPERGLDSGDSWLAMWPIRKGRGFGLVARDRPGARGGTPISRQKPKMLLGRKSPVPPPQSAGMKLVGY